MNSILRQNLLVAFRMALVTMILTGLLYPVSVTGAASLLFPAAAGGSLHRDQSGMAVGSGLIGQRFTEPRYLWPRPSAAGSGYDGLASGGSNLGPTSPRLTERAGGEYARLLAGNPAAGGGVPLELITASASGLDPHLTPEGALWQAPRIAGARGVSEERVRALLLELIEKPTLGFMGEARINVLDANLALDKLFGAKPF